MLQEDFTTKLLDLKGVKIKSCEIFAEKIIMDIEYEKRGNPCPDCGYVTSIVHDYRNQQVKDIPIQGKCVVLNYRRRRYRCPCCGKRFTERQKLIPRYHRLTNRFAYYLLELMKEKCSIKDIAKNNYVSSTKILNMLNMICYDKPKKLPRVLSIDEFKGNTDSKKFQCILTDPVNKRIADILPGRESHVLSEYFRQIKDRSNVEFVVMDMNKAYLEIAKAFFPKAKVIIDRFHVARYNTWAFENVRKSAQSKLDPSQRKYFKRSRRLLLSRMSTLSNESKDAVNIMLKTAPELTNAYLLKEKFYYFMDSKDSKEALDRLKEFILYAEIVNVPEYKACLTMLRNWQKYILNSFDYPYSNGYTEGKNNLIKVLKRVAFGYRKFENMRKRILLVSSKRV